MSTLVDDQEREATLTVTAGLAEGHPLPRSVSTDVNAGSVASLNSALRHHRVEEFDARTLELRLTGSPWPEPPQRGLILPVFAAGKAKLAAMVAFGVSPRQVLDGEYRTFFDLITRHFGAALAHADAYQAERRRAEALADIDRARTRSSGTPNSTPIGDILIEVGDAGTPFETHLIHKPRAVRVAVMQPGAEADIQFETDEGVTTLIRLRRRPELPDRPTDPVN